MSKEQVEQDLHWLVRQDRRLLAVRELAGEVLPRSRPPGFPGLARIICGQQLSVASADAIWKRLVQCNATQSPQAYLALDESTARNAGLSRTKFAYIRNVALAMEAGELELSQIALMPAELAIMELTRHKGIGPWTAEIYLMFCAAHPDIFPAGDLALRKSVSDAFATKTELDHKALAEMANLWAPRRTAAALLFWRYYAATRQRDSLPV